MTARGPRCTKCGSRELTLSEMCEHWGHIEQDAQGKLHGYDGPDGRDLVFEPGSVVGVWAACDSCGHRWKTRLHQITNHPDY